MILNPQLLFNDDIDAFASDAKSDKYLRAKKNRHSESVPRIPHQKALGPVILNTSAGALNRTRGPVRSIGRKGGKGQKRKAKSVQHPVFPSGRPPQY